MSKISQFIFDVIAFCFVWAFPAISIIVLVDGYPVGLNSVTILEGLSMVYLSGYLLLLLLLYLNGEFEDFLKKFDPYIDKLSSFFNRRNKIN